MIQSCHPIYQVKVKPLEVPSVRSDISSIVTNALINSTLKFTIGKRIIWGSINFIEHSVIVKKNVGFKLRNVWNVNILKIICGSHNSYLTNQNKNCIC